MGVCSLARSTGIQDLSQQMIIKTNAFNNSKSDLTNSFKGCRSLGLKTKRLEIKLNNTPSD